MYARKLAAFFAAWLCISCVSLTVNVNFPTEKFEDAAEEIEERVRSGQGVDGLETSAVPSSTVLQRNYALGFDGLTAYAQDKIDIEISTPIIKSIIKSRTERFKKIVPYMDSGAFGEDMVGYLALRDKQDFDLKKLTELKKLILEENKDREKLYIEILRANSIERNEKMMERVGKIFAEAIRKKMKPGRWYQVDEDTWVQKKEEKETDEA